MMRSALAPGTKNQYLTRLDSENPKNVLASPPPALPSWWNRNGTPTKARLSGPLFVQALQYLIHKLVGVRVFTAVNYLFFSRSKRQVRMDFLPVGFDC